MLLTRISNFALLISSAWLMTACLFDSGTDWSDGQFEVSWLDGSERYLYYDMGNGGGPSLVKQPVIAVGSNQIYIVIKSRDTAGSISYHYIVKSDEWKIPKGIGIAKGAYTEKEFLELTEKLSFPPFEKSFD